MFEGADTAAVGVAGLGHFGALLRVAEQDHSRCGHGCGQGVGQSELAGLVDDQDIDGVLAHRSAGEGQAVPARTSYSPVAHFLLSLR